MKLWRCVMSWFYGSGFYSRNDDLVAQLEEKEREERDLARNLVSASVRVTMKADDAVRQTEAIERGAKPHDEEDDLLREAKAALRLFDQGHRR